MTRQAAQAAGAEIGSMPILKQHETESTVAILLVTRRPRPWPGRSTRQIIRAGVRAAAELEAEGKTVTFYASGRRGVSSLTFRGRDVAGAYTGFTDRPAYSDARGIAEALMTAYVDGAVDRVDVFYKRLRLGAHPGGAPRDAAAAAAGDRAGGRASMTSTVARTRAHEGAEQPRRAACPRRLRARPRGDPPAAGAPTTSRSRSSGAAGEHGGREHRRAHGQAMRNASGERSGK